MGRKIKNYRISVDRLIEQNTNNWTKLKQEHLVQISFFQHERICHLFVMLAFAIMELISLMATVFLFRLSICILSILLLCLLIPYIVHYYHLENEVQKMYEQYDKICQLEESQQFR